MAEPETQSSEAYSLEQFHLIYDYTKFHIVLCLLTPSAIAIVAEALSIKYMFGFQLGLGTMIVIHLVSGMHAFMWLGRYVNLRKDADFLRNLEKDPFSRTRKVMHRPLYWIGLAIGISGLALAIFVKFV